MFAIERFDGCRMVFPPPMMRSILLTRFFRLFAVVLLCFPGSLQVAFSADWPQFRGPDAAGRSRDTGLPTVWDTDTNIVWRTALPGPGASSPVTLGDRIYITCYSGYGLNEQTPGDMAQLQRHLLCLNRADGSVVWDAKQPSTHPQQPYRGFIALHGYASGTPAADDTGIYVFYGTTGAAAYGHDGQQRWLTHCGAGTHGFGTANSPVLYGDLVIINASVECGDLIALEKKTGKEVWRLAGIDQSWNTPALVKTPAGAWELALNTKGAVIGVDPETGKKLWTCAAIDDYICPSVLAEGDMLYVIGGRRNTALAIRSGGRGDVTRTHKLWEINKGSNVSSPIYLDGHLYWSNESRGAAYCVNAKTGEVIYEERLDPNPGRIYASPVAADGKLYYVSRERGTYVLPAKPEFRQLAHSVITGDDSIFNGSPVISRGQILLRSDRFLYCIGR
jgi:outer membrane protein assembly factor BamB